MIIGIVGSRRRNTEEDFLAVKRAFVRAYKDGDSILSGGCPKGGDHFAERLSAENNIPIRIHQADWVKHGRAAGFIRNGLIAQDADILIACVAADRTGGTEDTIKKFRKFHPNGQVICV